MRAVEPVLPCWEAATRLRDAIGANCSYQFFADRCHRQLAAFRGEHSFPADDNWICQTAWSARGLDSERWIRALALTFERVRQGFLAREGSRDGHHDSQ